MLWVTDADNTLWDTNAVFESAQLQLLAGVETALHRQAGVADRLALVRSIDIAIARTDPAGLAYDPGRLVHGVARHLKCDPEHEPAIAAPAARLIAARFKRSIGRLPKLLPGVRVGLSAVRKAGWRIIVATESTEALTKARLAAHHLDGLVDGVVAGRKSEAFFAHLRRSHGGTGLAIAIGDQPLRDIEPARAAGYVTVYVPSRFRPDNVMAEAHVTARVYDEAVRAVLSPKFLGSMAAGSTQAAIGGGVPLALAETA